MYVLTTLYENNHYFEQRKRNFRIVYCTWKAIYKGKINRDV